MRTSNTKAQKLMNAGFVKRFNHEVRRSVSDSTVHQHMADHGLMEERKDRMPLRNQLIACVIRQYGAGMYRAWVSLDKGHMVCLGAYQDEADATETIDHFMETYRDGGIKTPEDILPHIDAQNLTAPVGAFGQSADQTATII